MPKKKGIVQKTVESAESPSPNRSDILHALGMSLAKKFDLYKRLRSAKEREWIQSLRQHKGLYDPDTLSKLEPNSSKVYPKVTRAKDNLVLSKLHEMLFPASDRNWSIEPTPVPNLPRDILKALFLSLIRPDEQGNRIPPTAEEVNRATQEFTKRACEEMQSQMDDQLIEMKYTVKVGKPVLRSGVVYGTGIAKGPLVNRASHPSYNINGHDVTVSTTDVSVPYFDFIPLWSWYPDLTVTEQEDMEGSFERHIYSRHQLRQLAALSGFNSSYITSYITNHQSGDYTPEPWEPTLWELTSESPTGTRKTEFGDYINMGNSSAGFPNYGGKYVVLEYWGYVDGHDLAACGEEVPEGELDSEIYANIWLLGGVPIKGVISPEPNRGSPYKLFYYEKDETSLYGEGLPLAIRHSQLSISAASRMCLNNASIAAGPMIEINTDLVDIETTDPLKIHPMKVWFRSGMGMESQYPGIRMYNMDSHIQEYLSIINQFMQFGDIEATLPTWMIAEPTKSANETAGAVSMKMGTINISLRDLVRNFDDYTESVVESLYLWNMEYNTRRDIKGDYKVRARGSTSLIMKEVRMNGLNMFATTMAPEDWAYIPRRQFLEERIKANELDIAVRTEEEASAYLQSLQDERLKELQYKDLEAEITKKNAMALNLASKGKKTSREAAAVSVSVLGGNGGMSGQ
jgi:hypothetical protein